MKGTKPIRRMHLLPNDTTIATVLSSAGYRTCLVNKWHLDGFNPEATPLNRGFDEFYGWLISTVFILTIHITILIGVLIMRNLKI